MLLFIVMSTLNIEFLVLANVYMSMHSLGYDTIGLLNTRWLAEQL